MKTIRQISNRKLAELEERIAAKQKRIYAKLITRLMHERMRRIGIDIGKPVCVTQKRKGIK